MTAEDTFGKRIVTKISPVSKFYEAKKTKITIMIINRNYCSYVITPKIDKLKKMFEDKKNNEERNHGRKRKY
jgi:peptide-methionine (S)-S-oxide reductase